MTTSHPKTSKNAIYGIENANNGGFGIGSTQKPSFEFDEGLSRRAV
jgi:hypothetical protein